MVRISPDVHLIDPIEMLEVSAEHQDGKEVDAQFWIVHVSEKKRQIMKTTEFIGNLVR